MSSPVDETFKPTYTCRQCKIKFDSKRDQLVHRKHFHETNSDEKKFWCKICHKGFANHANLDRHMASHVQLKPHKCQLCEKSFAQASNLHRHLSSVHNGDRPFQCEVCKKSFTQQGNLRRHQLIHTGEKPFRCKRCSRTFSQRTNLKKHIMAHQGLRPYQCEFCQKSFIQSQNYKKHLKSHGIDSPVIASTGQKIILTYLQCVTCDLICQTEEELQSHAVFCEDQTGHETLMHSTQLEFLQAQTPYSNN